MKWALAQLNKISMPYTFDECLDLSELVGFENIKSVNNVNVRTTIREYGDDTYQCEFKISCELGLEDSVTLEIINYKIDTETTELYTTNPETLDATIIETSTLDTKEAIIAQILSEKPVSISNHEFEDDYQDEDEAEEVDNINPAFASLKDLL